MLVRGVALALFLTGTPWAEAQTLEVHEEPTVGVSWARPSVADEPTSLVASVWNLYGGVQLDDGATVDVTIPLVYWELRSGASEFALGNPRLRFASGVFDDFARLDFALYVPVATTGRTNALLQGLRAAFLPRTEAFVPDQTAVAVGLERTFDVADDRFALYARWETSLWVPTGDRGGDVEIFVRPTIGLIGRLDVATARLALRARHWLTPGEVVELTENGFETRDVTFDEATIQDLRFEVEFAVGRFRPALSAAWSLDSALDDLAERTLGLRLTALLD